jgi:hypothetical protein
MKRETTNNTPKSYDDILTDLNIPTMLPSTGTNERLKNIEARLEAVEFLLQELNGSLHQPGEIT